MERKALEERDRLRATARAASALAYRRELYQYFGHFLLPVQRAGRLQPIPPALGTARIHDGGGHRNHSAGGQGEIPRGETADHYRQRPAIHRAGFQGIYSHIGDDAREDVALLPAVEREVGALAQIVKSECIRPGTPLTQED